MCDRVIVLDKGKLAFDGDVNEGIKFLKYDDASDNEPDQDGSDEENDEDLGADI